MSCPFWKTWFGARMCRRSGSLEVARHYELLGGVSPINAPESGPAGRTGHRAKRPRAAAAGLLGQPQLASIAAGSGPADGRRRRAARIGVCHFGVRFRIPVAGNISKTSPTPGEAVGPEAPQIDKLRLYYNHPGFIEATSDRVWNALEEVPAERCAERN